MEMADHRDRRAGDALRELSAQIPDKIRRNAGMAAPPADLRIGSVDDLIADLDQALRAAG